MHKKRRRKRFGRVSETKPNAGRHPQNRANHLCLYIIYFYIHLFYFILKNIQLFFLQIYSHKNYETLKKHPLILKGQTSNKLYIGPEEYYRSI